MGEHGPARWSGGKRSVQAVAPGQRPATAETAEPGVDATDAARALADESNIDLTTIDGTGAEGRITKDDVTAAITDAQIELDTDEAAQTTPDSDQST